MPLVFWFVCLLFEVSLELTMFLSSLFLFICLPIGHDGSDLHLAPQAGIMEIVN